MKTLLFLILSLLPCQTFALETSMILRGRFDYNHAETNFTPGIKDSSGIFTTSYLRLGVESKIDDTMKANVIFDFTDANTPKDNGLTELIDVAYVTRLIGRGSLLIGKQGVLIGGRENDYSARELYLFSAFNDATSASATGLTSRYDIFGQSFYAQYLQQRDSKQTPFSDKKILGVAYYGSFFEKMMEPILSYHKLGTTRPGQYDLFTATGVRMNIFLFIFEADYLMLKKEKAGINPALVAVDAKVNSSVLVARYHHEKYRPFVKYILDEGKRYYDLGNGINELETKRNAWEVGMEYYPKKDNDVRYHVVYNSAKLEEETGARDEYEEKKLIIGFSFGLNVMN